MQEIADYRADEFFGSTLSPPIELSGAAKTLMAKNAFCCSIFSRQKGVSDFVNAITQGNFEGEEWILRVSNEFNAPFACRVLALLAQRCSSRKFEA